MHSIDDYPQLSSKFSSDGEESFIDHSEASKHRTVIVKKVQGRMVKDANAEDRLGPGYNRHLSESPARARPTNLFSRLTSKLGIATPPRSPPLTSPSYSHLFPTHPNITPEVNYFSSNGQLLEHGLLSSKDLNVQEKAHDIYPVTVVHSDQFEHEVDRKKNTESKLIREKWKSKNLTDVENGTPRLSPIYPAVLATPRFSRSKSTPDISKYVRTLEAAEITDESTAVQLTAVAAPAVSLTQKSSPSVKSPVNDDTGVSSSTTPSSLSPSAQKWPRTPPNRDLPPLPTDKSNPPASPVLPVEISPHSVHPLGLNVIVTASPRTSMSQSHTLVMPSTPTSPNRRGSGGHSSARDRIGGETGVTGIGDPMVGPALPLALDHHAQGLEPNQSMFAAAEKNDRSNPIRTFSVIRPERRERRVSREAHTVRTPRRPCTADAQRPKTSDAQRPKTADAQRPKTSESSNSAQSHSRRRKSFVGQSLQNLRKSVTDTIIKARPKSPAAMPRTPLMIPSKYNAPELPPSPMLSLPKRPSTASDSRMSGARCSPGLSVQR